MSDHDQKLSFRNSQVAHSDKKKNLSHIEPDFNNDIFSQNKISMKDIDNYLSQNQMNFNFNDNLFGAFEDDIEKEIMNLRKTKPSGQGLNGQESAEKEKQ